MQITNAAPERWNFRNLVCGDRWPEENFDVENEDGVDILDFTVLMQLRSPSNLNVVVKELVIGDGFIKNGKNVKFDTNVDCPAGTYLHDIQITVSGNRSYTRYKGTVGAKSDISRPA